MFDLLGSLPVQVVSRLRARLRMLLAALVFAVGLSLGCSKVALAASRPIESAMA